MKLFAIGDFHLSGEPPQKPMDIFDKHWENHFQKIKQYWIDMITEEDTVLICGDTSWAIDLEDAAMDLNRIAELPGKKIILRGNHDYWWTSLKKMQQKTENTFSFLQNNFFPFGDYAVCGTRGWLLPSSEKFSPDDEHIYVREAIRLENSLSAAQKAGYEKFIVAMHYPPLYSEQEDTAFTELMGKYKVSYCAFAHIHGAEAAKIFQGSKNNIIYKLVSCDTQNFIPQRIL